MDIIVYIGFSKLLYKCLLGNWRNVDLRSTQYTNQFGAVISVCTLKRKLWMVWLFINSTRQRQQQHHYHAYKIENGLDFTQISSIHSFIFVTALIYRFAMWSDRFVDKNQTNDKKWKWIFYPYLSALPTHLYTQNRKKTEWNSLT